MGRRDGISAVSVHNGSSFDSDRVNAGRLFGGAILVIYGVALLSICLISGLFVGGLLGKIVGVQANVGGVGIAMVLLILSGHSKAFSYRT